MTLNYRVWSLPKARHTLFGDFAPLAESGTMNQSKWSITDGDDTKWQIVYFSPFYGSPAWRSIAFSPESEVPVIVQLGVRFVNELSASSMPMPGHIEQHSPFTVCRVACVAFAESTVPCQRPLWCRQSAFWRPSLLNQRTDGISFITKKKLKLKKFWRIWLLFRRHRIGKHWLLSSLPFTIWH